MAIIEGLAAPPTAAPVYNSPSSKYFPFFIGETETVVVPALAVLKLQGANNRYVFLNKGGKAKRVEVTLGRIYNTYCTLKNTIRINIASQFHLRTLLYRQKILFGKTHIRFQRIDFLNGNNRRLQYLSGSCF